jgi:surfactin synthase thioesterase subunit
MVSKEDMLDWRHYSGSRTEHFWYDGSHFYLIEPKCKLAFTNQVKAILSEPQTVHVQAAAK